MAGDVVLDRGGSAEGAESHVDAPHQRGPVRVDGTHPAASVFYRGGTSRGDNFRWEINGTQGDLVLTAPWGNIQVTDLTLQGGFGTDTAVAPMEGPAAYPADIPAGLTGPARNVAALYTDLARDLREGTRLAPDFTYAHTRHQLLAAIESASREGVTQTLG